LLQQVQAELRAGPEAGPFEVDATFQEVWWQGLSERTFVMIKPDGVRKGLVDEITGRIKRAGLKIISIRRMNLDSESANELYSVHKGKPFFEKLVKHVL
jgi:hypothetical protein